MFDNTRQWISDTDFFTEISKNKLLEKLLKEDEKISGHLGGKE